ncbi:MAG: hypothetical protein AUH11_12085 [Acidobacteria bacterium 13_2_20CM_57_17]|nr:MAG: hypothetical protein AUH11_12085 [Acidobacteria bacterium 13_2_20CM_57_17]OLB95614.1 MAG: hypothetical protein AUI02_03405 [Acidobacteria bacterium 13_2_20CM_2_57_12]OLE16050.1 MAG: hypothetical protein AUG83_04550 [Acidobacteria bacterium 13_1_20CM_4_57_11]
MATDEILRLHYYERQYLGAADLEDQQAYLRDMRRRHNIGHHTWGIVAGLLLVEEPVAGDPTAVDLFIQPGMAVDGFGREIIVMAPVKLDPQLFEAFANQQHRSVWIRYDQEFANQAKGGFAQCAGTIQFGRIQETYKIVIDPGTHTHDDVTVNGKKEDPTSTDLPIPTDDSIPYQEFPDDNNQPLWLIQLGWVNWDGVGLKFIPTNPPSRLTDDRSYVGAVAETIYGPVPVPAAPDPASDAPRFFIQPRILPVDPDTADFAEIKGRLQVDGRIIAMKDVMLHGGQLHFKDTGGGDPKIPLWMQRTSGPSGAGTDLHVHIGDDPADDKVRLSIGPKDGANEKDVLAVRASDNVDIPTGALNFGAALRQMINLWQDKYGIGIQPGTQYYRSDGDFYWFRGGKHSPTQGDPGAGGNVQMSLDASGNLNVSHDLNVGNDANFGASTRQMLNLWNINYGIGVQNSTLYHRTDFDFCWFRRGTHSDNRSDPGGGALAMKLDSGSNLSVMGDLSVAGNLSVTGSHNIFRVISQTFALNMAGLTTPRFWTYNYGGFSQIYTAFVVLQGFSIWDNDGDTSFTHFSNAADVNAIPQHVYVKIDGVPTTTQTSGHCFCSESLVGNEVDNTVLFTVVVMGRP